MAKQRTSFAVVALSVVMAFAALARAQSVDSLPSWNDGRAKRSIIAFVEQVTKAGSSDFVPPAVMLRRVSIHREGAFPSAGRLTRRAKLPGPDALVPVARPRNGSLGHASLRAPSTRIYSVSARSPHRCVSA